MSQTKLAVNVDELVVALRESTKGVKVKFIKKDGSLREGVFTLHTSLLPPIVVTKNSNSPSRAVNPTQLNMFELSKGWKSCLKTNLAGFEIIK